MLYICFIFVYLSVVSECVNFILLGELSKLYKNMGIYKRQVCSKHSEAFTEYSLYYVNVYSSTLHSCCTQYIIAIYYEVQSQALRHFIRYGLEQ